MAATHIITTVQAVDFAKIARDSAKEKEEGKEGRKREEKKSAGKIKSEKD